jgi:glucose/arabinose dehydrogenase
MAFLPNGDMLVTERSGKFYRVTKGKSLQIISGVPEVLNEGQGGLMDVELHPDFKNNNLIYLSYSKPQKNTNEVLSTTAVMRAVLKGNEIVQQKIIYEALPYEKTKHHYGCRLEFGKDGYLYFSVGDRGNQNKNPQDISNSLGKIHRIKDDGSIPADNPFVNTPNAVASIYSYGHRNPQGLALNPQTGEIWSNEHGPRGGDEVNLITKGANYGWPVISYGISYDATTFTKKTQMESMEQPLLYWVPSIAPSGMAFVKGGKYKSWEGDALIGSLRFNYLNLCKIKDNKIVSEEILLKNIGRMRDVRVSPDGYIYVAVEKPGAIFRLVPVNN